MTRRGPTTARIAASMVIAASLLPVGEARAEPESGRPPTITVGSKVRLRAPTVVKGRIEGTVSKLGEEFLVVVRPDHGPQTISRQAITRLEVSTGRRRQALKGMRNGAVIGGVWMATACGLYADCDGWASPIAGGALAGALVGVGIGALMKSDRWQSVPLDRVRVTLTPAPRGVGLVVSIGF